VDHVLELEAINPATVEWPRVHRSRYVVHQHFAYEYPARILDLRHQLMVVPPDTFGDQRRSVYSVEVSVPGEVITRTDSFANTVLDVRIPLVERAIEFDVQIMIERAGPVRPRVLPGAWLHDERLLTATPRTMPDDAIVAAAHWLQGSGQQGLALAELANAWVHSKMTYAPGLTNVHTTAADALQLGGGVCQDYAHLMIALCRQLRLPALYVSGHLLGEGATHAWVEVLLPAADGSGNAEGWPFDPTNACHVDLTYLTVAVGRDYDDVAPTSGSYRAGHGGQLTAHKDVRVVEVAYEG
jgi:transglutaminase-like putative cysteine protease